MASYGRMQLAKAKSTIIVPSTREKKKKIEALAGAANRPCRLISQECDLLVGI